MCLRKLAWFLWACGSFNLTNQFSSPNIRLTSWPREFWWQKSRISLKIPLRQSTVGCFMHNKGMDWLRYIVFETHSLHSIRDRQILSLLMSIKPINLSNQPMQSTRSTSLPIWKVCLYSGFDLRFLPALNYLSHTQLPEPWLIQKTLSANFLAKQWQQSFQDNSNTIPQNLCVSFQVWFPLLWIRINLDKT